MMMKGGFLNQTFRYIDPNFTHFIPETSMIFSSLVFAVSTQVDEKSSSPCNDPKVNIKSHHMCMIFIVKLTSSHD